LIANEYIIWQDTHRSLDRENTISESLRIFGCIAYVHIPTETHTKLQLKSIKCQFIGYGELTKGYWCWNSEQKKIIISHHVVFDEMSYGKLTKKEEINGKMYSEDEMDTSDDTNLTSETNCELNSREYTKCD
jgi:hypothetical protein